MSCRRSQSVKKCFCCGLRGEDGQTDRHLERRRDRAGFSVPAWGVRVSKAEATSHVPVLAGRSSAFGWQRRTLGLCSFAPADRLASAGTCGLPRVSEGRCSQKHEGVRVTKAPRVSQAARRAALARPSHCRRLLRRAGARLTACALLVSQRVPAPCPECRSSVPAGKRRAEVGRERSSTAVFCTSGDCFRESLC